MSRTAASIVLVLGLVAAPPAWSAAGGQPPATPNPVEPAPPAAPIPSSPVTTDPAAVGPMLAAPDRPTLSDLDLAALDGLVQQALQKQPDDARVLYSAAMVNRVRGRTQPAFEQARRLVALAPDQPAYQFLYGTLEFETIADAGTLEAAGKAGRGRDALLKTIELDPNHVEARVGLALFYSQAPWIAGGSSSKARRMADELLGIPGGAGEFQGRMALARLAADDDEWDEAAKQFDLAAKARGLGASPAAALAAHAAMLIDQKKDFAAAARVLDRAVAADPEHTQVAFNRGRLAARDQNHALAVEQFGKVLAKNPQARNSRYMLAESLEALGRKAEAADTFADFAARFPTDRRAKDATAAAARLRK